MSLSFPVRSPTLTNDLNVAGNRGSFFKTSSKLLPEKMLRLSMSIPSLIYSFEIDDLAISKDSNSDTPDETKFDNTFEKRAMVEFEISSPNTGKFSKRL